MPAQAVALALHRLGGQMGFDEVAASGELCELAKSGHTEQLKLMLEVGVRATAADYDRRTALHLGARRRASHVPTHPPYA